MKGRAAMTSALPLILVTAIAGPFSVPVLHAADQAVAEPPHRVVMHLNSGDQQVQRGALNNIRNLYRELGPRGVAVELVVHGAGLPLLVAKDTAFAKELGELKDAFGVSYTACSNTMKGLGLTRADLIEPVDRTVPAMVRLMELQEAGWAYIKP